MQKIYNLDHAAGAPLNKDAKKAVQKLLDSPFYNPDGSYAPAVDLRRHLADIKNKTAKLLGVKAPNVFITSGSSDASKTLFELIKQAAPDSTAITTQIEHSTLLEALAIFKEHQIISVSQDGKLDLEELKSHITDTTTLISVQYVNNETGQIFPIKEISGLIKEVRENRRKKKVNLPLYFHTDASQAAITQDLLIPRLGVDALSLNGSKFGALPNSGLLYLSADILRWLDQKEVKVLNKKENLLSTISLYPSLKHAIEKRNTETKRLAKLAQAFFSEFQKELPEVRLNPAKLKFGKNHSAHILNIQVSGVSGEKLVILAGLNGILISTGAACSASKDRPSHVLKTLGLNLKEINSSIRVSFGSDNKSETEVKLAAKELAELCKNPAVKVK